MALTLPDPHQMESLKDRALRGKDLLFLRQWAGLSIADCCYLLGMPVVRWHYYQKHPDHLIDDAGELRLSLLLNALETPLAKVYYNRGVHDATRLIASRLDDVEALKF